MSGPDWIPILAISLILLWVAVITLAILVLASLRHVAFLYERLEPIFRFRRRPSPLRRDEVIPSVDLEREGGGLVTLSPRQRSLLLVVQSTCSPCRELLSIAPAELLRLPSLVDSAVVIAGPSSSSDAARLREDFQIPESIAVLADPRGVVPERWGVERTPSAMALGAGGQLHKFVPMVSAAELRSLVHDFTASVPPELSRPSEPVIASSALQRR